MNDISAPSPDQPADTPKPAEKAEKKQDSFFVFLIKLVTIIVIFRSFVFSPFSIPSESMLPLLRNGDYLLAAKWPYGYSKYSLPFSAPLIPGRIFAGTPEAGDVVIFKQPPKADVDYIKRVIGLPGDQLQVIDGVLHINGTAVKKEKLKDFEIAVSANTGCAAMAFEATGADRQPVCRYPRYRETLPNGVSYNVLDFGPADRNNPYGIDADNTDPVIVPNGHLFVMGDNRDNSQDSRFPAKPGAGVGMVPQANLVGRATVIMFSTDGSSSWVKPWTWFSAANWDRIGNGL